MAAEVAAPSAPATQEQRRTLTTASLATLLVLATFVTPLGTSVRTAAEFSAGAGAQAWMLSSISVGLAAALLTAGVLADDLGRRRVFTGGLVVLGLGAVVVAAAGSPGVFIAGRVVQGVGAAGVLACGLGLIGAAFPLGPARARAAAVWGASLGAGAGVGALATVALDHGQAWRTSYAVAAGLALVLAVTSHRTLVETVVRSGRRVDLGGIVTLAGGLSCVLAGLVQSRSGWSRTDVVVLLGVGALLLVGFVLIEGRIAQPMLDLSLLRIPGFRAATIGALLVGGAGVGVSSYLPTVLQRGLGESLLQASLLIAAWSAISTVTALAVRRLPGLDGRVLLAASLAVTAVGLAGYAVLSPGASVWRMLPGLVVLGIGYGAGNAALGREAVAHVPPHLAAMGAGANNTARYVGAAIGVTLVALAVGHGTPTGTTEGLLAGWNTAVIGGAVVSAVGALLVALIRPARQEARPAASAT